MSTTFTKTLAKYLPGQQARKKFRRQCLKAKNILEENESIQIGCKIQKLYDFYTSKNYLQVNIFIGNKMSKPINKYAIEFRGTPNLEVFIEEKDNKCIKENTQGKERIIVEWLAEGDATGQMLLTISFTSSVLTLKDTVIPLSLWSFYNFPEKLQQIISPWISGPSLVQTFRQKYELMEEQEVEINVGLFRKGFNIKELEKFMDRLIRIESKRTGGEGVEEERAWFGGVFTVKTLLDEVGVMVEVDGRDVQPIMKVTLAGNEYTYFEAMFANIKFLFNK